MHLNKQLKSRFKKHKQNTREIIGNPITKGKDTKEIQYVKLKRGRNSIWYFGQSAINEERAQ
jgi:hypothetical protein